MTHWDEMGFQYVALIYCTGARSEKNHFRDGIKKFLEWEVIVVQKAVGQFRWSRPHTNTSRESGCSTKLPFQTALPNCPSKLTSSQADLIGQQGKRRLYLSGLYIEFSTRAPLDPLLPVYRLFVLETEWKISHIQKHKQYHTVMVLRAFGTD